MLTGLSIRDVVLIDRLDLAFGPGLTVFTGETGAGKSIILDALGLAIGARADAALARAGASQASVTAVFEVGDEAEVQALLADRDLATSAGEDLVLRRTLGADGRSRAFVNDQPVGVSLLRELGALLVEVHGQHDTVGLLDSRTHRALLDAFARAGDAVQACGEAWRRRRAARARLDAAVAAEAGAAAAIAELTEQLAELDRLAPRPGEEQSLAERRILLGAAEKTSAELFAVREHLGSEAFGHGLGQAARSLERARQRVQAAGVDAASPVMAALESAAAAIERLLIDSSEAAEQLDAAAEYFAFEPEDLERAEERLFAIRALARKHGVAPEALPDLRADLAARLLAGEEGRFDLAAAAAEKAAADAGYEAAAEALTHARQEAGERLAETVRRELKPLKLDKARFQVRLDALDESAWGPGGRERVEFQIATLPDVPFQGLGAVASGGELARLALALKAALAEHGGGARRLLIFDEVDQGVGGAVADAVGLRLRRLAGASQVFAVTHSPQVAARGDTQLQVRKVGSGVAATVLAAPEREEEIARMLSGSSVTDAARAAARALIDA